MLVDRGQNAKVNFLIVGAQKAGTTALFEGLRNHSEIYMPEVKELHFFDNDDFFSKPDVDYSIYVSPFNFNSRVKLYGEVTPSYMFWAPCMKRIWRYNKDMKLIAVLRNPITRAFSHWNMQVERNIEKHDFYYCIQNESARLKNATPLDIRRYSYVERGLYAEQIERMLHFFDKKQILFIKYEAFLENQETTIEQILTFLNVSSIDHEIKLIKTHNIPYKKKLSKIAFDYLSSFYKKDINKVEEMLGWDCRDWKHIFI
ncbi:MAG: sulfotransferase [Bacteroidota bacterium]